MRKGRVFTNITEIISHCQLGDLEAFEQLYKTYYRKAFGTAYNICNQRNIAEDIVQEAFIICYKSINQIKDAKSFNTWFYKIIVRLSWRMSEKLRNSKQPAYDSISASIGDSTEDICNSLLLRQKIQTLKLSLRTVLVLHYFNDMSVREISKVLGCFEGTVKSRLFKARKILEHELSSYYRDSNNMNTINMEVGFNE